MAEWEWNNGAEPLGLFDRIPPECLFIVDLTRCLPEIQLSVN